jgi:peroxiredoxin
VGDERQFQKLSDFDADVILLDFQHAFCYTCGQSTPVFDTVYREFRDSGLVVVGVNSRDDKGAALSFMRDHGATYPVLLVDEDVDSLYGVTFHPTIYVLDRNHNVMFAQIGFDNNRLRIEDVVTKALRSARSD